MIVLMDFDEENECNSGRPSIVSYSFGWSHFVFLLSSLELVISANKKKRKHDMKIADSIKSN